MSEHVWEPRAEGVRNPLKEALVNLKGWILQPREDSATKTLITRDTSPFANSITFADILVTSVYDTPSTSSSILKDFETKVFSAQNGVDIEFDGGDGSFAETGFTLAKWVSAMEKYRVYGVGAYNAEADATQQSMGMPYTAIHSFGVVTIVNTSKEAWRPGDRIIVRFCIDKDEADWLLAKKPLEDKEPDDRVPFYVERYDSTKHGWFFVGAKMHAALTKASTKFDTTDEAVVQKALGIHLYKMAKTLRKTFAFANEEDYYTLPSYLDVARFITLGKTDTANPLTSDEKKTAAEVMDGLKWYGGPLDLFWRNWTLGTCNGYIASGDNGEVTLRKF